MKKKRLIFLLNLVVWGSFIVLVGRVISTAINQPVTAKLVAGKSTSSPGTYDIALTPVLKTGRYVSFRYPKGLTLNPPQKPYGSIVEEYVFFAHDVESWQLGIDITKVTIGGLDGFGSYVIREQNPKEYTLSSVVANGQTIPVMTDLLAGEFSKVAYLVHGDYIATVSLTGDDSSGVAPLQTTFSMVLNSWRWL
ncbi:MAG TPA: hypothetical protein VMR18_00430 [Candidatus Saccharimonadales bacterium]|nr:hypothetical protein [Candidatus Saccharimonadales bacterium]